MIARSALGLGALAFAGQDALAADAKPKSVAAKFNHRGYLGWITDLASEPDRSAAWPSMRLEHSGIGGVSGSDL